MFWYATIVDPFSISILQKIKSMMEWEVVSNAGFDLGVKKMGCTYYVSLTFSISTGWWDTLELLLEA